MIGVDFGNHERDIREHAEAARVADDDVTGSCKGGLDVLGGAGVEGGEKDLRRTSRVHASTPMPRTLAGGSVDRRHFIASR